MRGATHEKSDAPLRSENALATRDLNRSPQVREKTVKAPGSTNLLFDASNGASLPPGAQATSLSSGSSTYVPSLGHVTELQGHSLDWNDFGRREPAPGGHRHKRSAPSHARTHSRSAQLPHVGLLVAPNHEPKVVLHAPPERSPSFAPTRQTRSYWFHPAPSPSAHSPKLASSSSQTLALSVSLFSSVHLTSEACWIGMYFLLNLALTLYNKFVLVRVPFPYTLTAIHALCGSLGCTLLVSNSIFIPSPLNTREKLLFLAFSILYTINIVVSNVSLQLVTIPFHQVVRALTPLFTLAISYMLWSTHVSIRTLISLVPIIVGVCLATFGDYSFTRWGLALTLLGTLLAALKTIFTNVLQMRVSSSSPSEHRTSRSISSFPRSPCVVEKGPPIPDTPGGNGGGSRRRIHPLDLLYRMSPLALVQCVMYAAVTGELEAVYSSVCFWSCRPGDSRSGMETGVVVRPRDVAVLAVNGLLAFALNYVSFTANRKAGALSMTVAANVKQVLTILCAVLVFNITVTPLNLLGIVLTLGGGAFYAAVEYQQKSKRKLNEHKLTTAPKGSRGTWEGGRISSLFPPVSGERVGLGLVSPNR